MLSFDDPRWAELEAGDRTPTDLRPLLRQLETASEPQAAWDALWDAMYHQGDVGPASYVASPRHLVVDGFERRAEPPWTRSDYDAAVRDMTKMGLSELPRATISEVTGVNAAGEMGPTPTGAVASNPICPECATFLEGQGVTPLSPLR